MADASVLERYRAVLGRLTGLEDDVLLDDVRIGDLRALLELVAAAGELPCILDVGDYTMVRNTHLRALTAALTRVTQAGG